MKINENKKTISQLLLAILKYGVATTIDITWAMSASKSASRMRWAHLRGNPDSSIGKRFVADLEYNREEYKRYHALLSRLKEQGLVETNIIGSDRVWSITKSGLSFMRPKENKINNAGALSVTGNPTIISYDIPERMRRERDRIRETLKLMGFEQVHQSVWFGNRKVTKQFLALLRARQIFGYIHIFEINKTGTLKRLD
ncbi:MAG: hypothetical protein HZA94_02325 [Candidatus Vogelbacteria bacterium]|nr:hypothetical protein [Candidatus Vogelbacteria bacterium]